MIIRSAEFVTSAVRAEQYPTTGFPEVAFVGRSNVGKSSLLNKLVNRRQLARTSGHPGKTQLINFFSINESLHLVDLPGYGYARVSKQQQATWGPMVETYLQRRSQLRLVVQLIDLRHEPSREDKQMNEWLRHFGVPLLVVTTKADKLSRTERDKQERMIRRELQISAPEALIVTSAGKGTGIEDVWNVIESYTVPGPESALLK